MLINIYHTTTLLPRQLMGEYMIQVGLVLTQPNLAKTYFKNTLQLVHVEMSSPAIKKPTKSDLTFQCKLS